VFGDTLATPSTFGESFKTNEEEGTSLLSYELGLKDEDIVKQCQFLDFPCTQIFIVLFPDVWSFLALMLI